jgi:glutamate synthase (NADPH) small chain
MGQAKSPAQPKERRLTNVHEVVLGFGKKENLEESRRCPQCAQPVCLTGCPLGIDISGFIRLLREDDAASALERILKENPFPAVCGRICPAPCERACIFEEEGQPIGIRSLERYAADFGRNKTSPKAGPANGKSIAIAGAGPAGLSAAFFLARAGCKVTIFEAMPEPGGLLRYGVPEFRLPQKVLNEQIALLSSMGVSIRTNVLIGSTISVRDILAQEHQVLLLTTGAGLPEFTQLPGAELGGVWPAEEFLLRAQMASKDNAFKAGVLLGTRTAVVGRGYPALDSARIARRLGQQVDIIFDGLEENFAVRPEDLSMATEEGVRLNGPLQAVTIEGDENGFVSCVVCRKLNVVEEGDRLQVVADENAKEIIPVDNVIISNGRRPSMLLSQELPQLKFADQKTIWTDPATGLTSIERVFAAGNLVTGAGAVVDAIASGKKAAHKILEFFAL